MTSIEARLRRLEGDCFSDAAIIEKLIRDGMFYDDLSSEQRRVYDKYKGFSLLEAYQKVGEMMGLDPASVGVPHEPLILNFRTKEDEQRFLSARIEEVRQIVEETIFEDPTF